MSSGQAAGGAFDETTRSAMPSRGVVHAHLLRHGEVQGFARRGVRGQADVPLSPVGADQHQRLATWFAAVEPAPDLVLSSDLERCHDLARRVATAGGAPLVLDPRLREQDMGSWEGRTWAEISAEHGRAVNDYWDDYVGRAPPGGESLAQVSERALAAWREHVLGDTLSADGSRRVVLVTHIGVIRVLLCHTLGLGLDQALRFAPAAASHTSLLCAAAGAVVNGLGERPWLTAAGPRPGAIGTAPRIALSGSAGTGKTTLGRALAAELGLPFIEEPMRARLEDGLDLRSISHDDLRRLLGELWAEQHAAEQASRDGFVSDRSAADFAAFWIHYGFHHGPGDTEARMAQWLHALQDYDRVLLLPWGVLPLEHDGVRSTNRWIQFMFQSLVEGLLDRHAAPGRVLRVPPSDDFELRLAFARRAVGR